MDVYERYFSACGYGDVLVMVALSTFTALTVTLTLTRWAFEWRARREDPDAQ